MLKVLVIDESEERAVEISAGLIASGYQVAAVLPDAYKLMDQVAQSIPTLTDRLIQQAVHQLRSPLFAAEFSESSEGFGPGRSAHQAVKAAQQ